MIDIDDFYMIPCMLDMSDEWKYLFLYRSAAGLLSKYLKCVLLNVLVMRVAVAVLITMDSVILRRHFVRM